MRTVSALCFSLWAAMLFGCTENSVLCSPLPNWAVAVDVRDSVTDARVVSGALGAVFFAGALNDSLRPDVLLHLSSDTLLIGGTAEGEVEVRIGRAGYLAWSTSDVQTRLSQGECPQWETQELTARLQAAPE